eukprot:10200916-Lingulodinium_polyedra.AAC.1
MGSGEKEVKEIKILGRIVRWTSDGIEYEADGKHREELMKMNGLKEDSKAVGGVARRAREEEAEEDA